ncbi:MAG: glycosyltransferase family 4 protein [Candidatus Hinthialibacter sp.]
MESVDLTFIISDLGSGGAQRVLTTLAQIWAEKGYRICVATFADSSSDFFELPDSIRRIVVGGMGESRHALEALRMNIRRVLGLRRALRESGAPLAVSFVGTTNIQTVLASLGLGVRLVISERNDPARQSLGRFWDFMRRRCYRWADRVTANSRGALVALSEFVPLKKLAYVPNPLLVPPDDEVKGPRAPTVLAVGRLHPQKAYDILLPAFAQAAGNHPEWQLNILGEGELRGELQRMGEELGIGERVHWLGCSKDAFSFYRNADIFVLPSRHEGTPNALLEAMACGLPVIVSDASPGPLEYVKNEEAGLAAPVDDVEALAEALRRLMSDAGLRERLGRRAKELTFNLAPPQAIEVWEQVIGLPKKF